MAIPHVQEAIADGGGFRIVGDHEDGLVELLIGAPQHGEHGVGIGRIQIAGWLVREYQGRPRDERARDRDALLLPAGELGWSVVKTSGDAEQVREIAERTSGPAAADGHRSGGC